MGTKRLYMLAVPEDSLTESVSSRDRNTAKFGFVNTAGQSVQSISQEPGQRRLRGVYRGAFAEDMVEEISELANASTIGNIPYFDESGTTQDDGYYAVEQSSATPAKPSFEGLHPFDISLTKAGTRKTSWRQVPLWLFTPSSPFGSTAQALVAIPSAASKVRWMDTESGATQLASPTDTVTAEYGDLDRYDAVDSPFSNESSALIYDVAYAEESKTDVSLWDTKGYTNKIDANDVRQWQHVFEPGHEFDGDCVLDTGRLRLTLDEETPSVSAERYDGSAWASVALSPGDWTLFDFDITYYDGVRVDVQLLFYDTVADELAGVDAIAMRGRNGILFTVPANQSSLDSSLVTYLSDLEIADTVYATPEKSLIDRTEVRL